VALTLFCGAYLAEGYSRRDSSHPARTVRGRRTLFGIGYWPKMVACGDPAGGAGGFSDPRDRKSRDSERSRDTV